MTDTTAHLPPLPAALPVDGIGLAALENRLRADLAVLNWPGKDWIPRRAVGDEPVLDAVIVGAGMCGLVAWLALTTAGIRNIRIIDRAPAGFEGPWMTFARMETLRSPTQLTGPAYGHAALAFQSWYRAQHGRAAWEAMDRIPRPMWMDYLRWYRGVLGVPVENGTALDTVGPGPEGLLRLSLSGTGGGAVLTRRLVMATGRDGSGRPTIPGFVADLPKRLWAHSSEEIDFDALKGRRVAVVGVGASAIDNAAEALEHGAAEVRHLIRRPKMPTINKMMGIGSYGFTAGYPDLSDAWRWRFMRYAFAQQTPSPRGSTLRVSRHPNAYFHFGAPVTGTEVAGKGLRIALGGGRAIETDFLILGTGFTTDPQARVEMGAAAAEIALWSDRYAPPAGEENADLALNPYLGPDFGFREKHPGQAPWLERVHCFNYGANLSLGKVSGDIPGVSEGASWLARSLASAFYAEDVAAQYRLLEAYDTPELKGDEWREDPLPQLTKEPAT